MSWFNWDDKTDPIGVVPADEKEDLGWCYKCNTKLCSALDSYFGRASWAKHLCKECRYKYVRSLKDE